MPPSPRSCRIGLIGLGQIGRQIFRLAATRPDVDIVAVADIGKPEVLRYLLETTGDEFHCRLEGNQLRGNGFSARMLQLGGPGDQRIEKFRRAADRDPQFDPHHGALGHAAVEFFEAGLGVLRVEVHQAQGAIAVMGEGLEHFVVLLAQFGGGRILREGLPHADDLAFDAHPAGDLHQAGHALGGGRAGKSGQVPMQIPDHRGGMLVGGREGTGDEG